MRETNVGGGGLMEGRGREETRCGTAVPGLVQVERLFKWTHVSALSASKQSNHQARIEIKRDIGTEDDRGERRLRLEDIQFPGFAKVSVLSPHPRGLIRGSRHWLGAACFKKRTLFKSRRDANVGPVSRSKKRQKE